MSKISISPDELDIQARVYEDACELITQGRTQIEATNSYMAEHWQGGAYQGYLAQYEQVLRPAIEKYNQVMQECCAQLKSYANFMRENDAAAKDHFKSSI